MQETSKKNNCFDTFAWLIHREVENYINSHINEYENWRQERAADSKGEDKAENKTALA